MPKLRTHKSTVKRIKQTKTGKILRANAASHHFLTHHTKRNNRSKEAPSEITGKIKSNIKRALGE